MDQVIEFTLTGLVSIVIVVGVLAAYGFVIDKIFEEASIGKDKSKSIAKTILIVGFSAVFLFICYMIGATFAR